MICRLISSAFMIFILFCVCIHVCHRYYLGMSEVAAMEVLSGYAPAIMEWCETYMKKEPVSGSGEIEFKRYIHVDTEIY